MTLAAAGVMGLSEAELAAAKGEPALLCRRREPSEESSEESSGESSGDI